MGLLVSFKKVRFCFWIFWIVLRVRIGLVVEFFMFLVGFREFVVFIYCFGDIFFMVISFK